MSIATVCVRRDAGDPTAPTAAPVNTEVRAPLRTAPACALRATAAPTAGEVKFHPPHIHILYFTLSTAAEKRRRGGKHFKKSSSSTVDMF